MKLPVRYLRIYDKFLSWLKTADSTELQDKALRIIEGAKKSARATFEDSRDKSITAEKLEALRPTAASFMDMDADRKFITSFPEVTVYYTKRRGIVGAIVTDNNSSSSTTTSSSSSSSTTSTSSSSSSGNNDESEERCLYLFTDVLAIITRKKTKKNKRPKLTMKDCLSLSEVVLLRDNNNSNSNSDPRVLRLWYDKSIITIRLASPDERETLWFELGARAKMVAQEGTDPSQVPSPPEVITALPRIVEAEGRAALGVPMLVENSCRYLAEHLDQPGLFRVAGSRELAMGVYRLVEADPKHRIPSRSEPYMVAYVLKTFLQRLDTPLATTELYSDYIELATFESEMVQADPVGRRDTIAREAALIYDRMPFVNLQTYLLVIDLLSRIAEKSALNTMSVRNLAAIFTPNIFGCKGANNKEFTNVQKLTHLMESLIEYQPVIKSLMSVKQTVFL